MQHTCPRRGAPKRRNRAWAWWHRHPVARTGVRACAHGSALPAWSRKPSRRCHSRGVFRGRHLHPAWSRTGLFISRRTHDISIVAMSSATYQSRTYFRAKLTLAAGALVGTSALIGLLPEMAGAASSASAGDIAILNYALTLEYLEEVFYSAANRDHHLAVPARGLDRYLHQAYSDPASGPDPGIRSRWNSRASACHGVPTPTGTCRLTRNRTCVHRRLGRMCRFADGGGNASTSR